MSLSNLLKVKVHIPIQGVQKHDPSDSEHEEGKFHVFEAQLEQSFLSTQVFHPTESFPNCQIHDSARPIAI